MPHRDGGGLRFGMVDNLVERVRTFVDEVITPFEADPRWTAHGPSDEMVAEMRALAMGDGLLTPHLADGRHLTQVDIVPLFRAAGRSPLGPLALNVAAPDEGNMLLLDRVATAQQKRRFLKPLVTGQARSAFLMTEPAEDGGAGSDPSMLRTAAVRDGPGWRIDGRKAFITGYIGADFGILMARTSQEDAPVSATMFLIDLPDPAIAVEHVPDTLDGSMPGGHATLRLEGLRVAADAVLGEVDQGFRYAQLRLAPARLSHCMRWHGAATRAHEVAADYARRRQAFGKALIDHEGVGFMLADNVMDLKQAELMIDWCAAVLDRGDLGTAESSMAKVAVSEALYRVADRCVQVMGGYGVSGDFIVERVFRELRSFRIYDGPSEVHRWSLAKLIKKGRL